MQVLQKHKLIIKEINSQSSIINDIISGLTVAVLFIPQSMAYANIAGVNPVYGLYAAVIPLFIYTLFSSSKHLSVGPTSVVSILAFSSISTITKPESLHYFEAMTALTILIGVIQFSLGVLHAGKIFKYISNSVIKGFISAVAIIIIIHQLDSLIGVHISSQKNLISISSEISKQFYQFHPDTTIIGVSCLVILILFKKLSKYPIGPLLILFCSPAIVKLFHLHLSGVEIIGFIPNDLPSPALPNITYTDLGQLVAPACIIAFISFIESYTVAKSISEKTNYQIEADRELISLGTANFSSGLIGSIPVAGALSRSAVNFQSGAKTKLANIVTIMILIITLIFFTHAFYYLPISALSAVIIISVFNLIDINGMLKTLRTSVIDGLILFTTFLSTICIGVIYGLIIGIVFSMFAHLLKRPRTTF
ncbi:hypothetical protein J6TS2_21280 [Heyndrickxia sporothermodurans]|nr:hypothetical protein J6TS2_21280 [Heyndrickxia sporothermodurans]